MIQILLVRAQGRLALSAKGHALYGKKGQDIVCAAVTVLARTAAQTLGSRPGIAFEGALPNRGELSFEARALEDSAKAGLDFAADFLQKGFEGLSKEFPQNVQFECNLEE